MSEKPILFSTPMVQSIFKDRKSQTRRVIKFPEGMTGRLPESGFEGNEPYLFYPGGIKRPSYKTGDTLWVRETWCYSPCDCEYPCNHKGYMYKADGWTDDAKWKPSIHMPRKAARLFLTVKSIRVERLRDITEEDAIAEGISRLFDDMPKEEYERWSKNVKSHGFPTGTQEEQSYNNYLWHGNDVPKHLIEGWEYQYSGYKSARDSFSSLWQLINADRGCGWDSNPYVWVVEFEKK
jgi:hypothetical protein